MNKKELDIITCFTLLDMEDYYNELETAINTIIERIPNFKDTYFLLFGEPYQEVYAFNTESKARHFLLETIEGKKTFSKYGNYTLNHGEKCLECF